MLKKLVKEKVKAIVCLGKDNRKLHDAFEGVVKNMVDAGSMEEAVKAAYYLARNGDTVFFRRLVQVSTFSKITKTGEHSLNKK